MATSGKVDNSGTPCFLRLSVNIISRVLVLFSCRLFSCAQLSTWSISLHRVSAQLAGTMMYVSSAYLSLLDEPIQSIQWLQMAVTT